MEIVTQITATIYKQYFNYVLPRIKEARCDHTVTTLMILVLVDEYLKTKTLKAYFVPGWLMFHLKLKKP